MLPEPEAQGSGLDWGWHSSPRIPWGWQRDGRGRSFGKTAASLPWTRSLATPRTIWPFRWTHVPCRQTLRVFPLGLASALKVETAERLALFCWKGAASLEQSWCVKCAWGSLLLVADWPDSVDRPEGKSHWHRWRRAAEGGGSTS